jgi:hypothetical protein
VKRADIEKKDEVEWGLWSFEVTTNSDSFQEFVSVLRSVSLEIREKSIEQVELWS